MTRALTGRREAGRRAKVWGLLLVMLWLPAVAGGAEPAYGRAADVRFARVLWQALERLQLAGPKAYQTVPYSGLYPHGSVLELLDTLHLTVDGAAGPVLVLRNYRGRRLTPRRVRSAPDKYLDSIAVMFGRDGFDATDHDWFWAEFQPDGALKRNPAGRRLAGRIAGNNGCIACHRAAPGADLVFNNNRFR